MGLTGLMCDRQLFGEDEDSTYELDEAENQGENGAPPFDLCIPLNALFTLDVDSGPRSAPSPGNRKSAEGSTGIQVRPSCAAFEGYQFQRREDGVSEGTVAFITVWNINLITRL